MQKLMVTILITIFAFISVILYKGKWHGFALRNFAIHDICCQINLSLLLYNKYQMCKYKQECKGSVVNAMDFIMCD